MDFSKDEYKIQNLNSFAGMIWPKINTIVPSIGAVGGIKNGLSWLFI